MKETIILTHFSDPNWPAVNKIIGICRCLGVRHEHFPETNGLIKGLSSLKNYKILFFSDDVLIDLFFEIDRQFSKQLDIQIAMILKESIPALAEKASKCGIIRHMIGLENIESSGKDLSILIRKFSEDNFLNLDKYLSFGCHIKSLNIFDPDSKKKALDAVHDYIVNLGDPGYNHPFHEYGTIVSEIVDELVINAIFNATPRLKKTPRSAPYKLENKELIELSWAYDGEYFGVSVKDPLGKFSNETIMNYLARAPTQEELLTSTSGGLGLKIVFDKSHKIIANIVPGKLTEIIVLLRFETRMLAFEKKKKSFYFFASESKKQAA